LASVLGTIGSIARKHAQEQPTAKQAISWKCSSGTCFTSSGEESFSPDGKWMLFPQIDGQSSNLIMIEGLQ
jgi:hypothetical protein